MQQRLPQLDGVRGLAILLVIFHNETSKYASLHLGGIFRSGWMGVDLFFVLSGFLITGILLDTKNSDGYFRNFYARRCLRIWPLYYLSLLLMFVVVPLVRPAEGQVIFNRSSPWWAYPLYLQNILVPDPTGGTGLLGVTWSLAIEEQFYLLWPIMVRWSSNTVLRRIAVAVICLSPPLRLFLSRWNVDLYSNTLTRLDGLMAGALLATVVRSSEFVPSRFVRQAWMLFLIATPLALLADWSDTRWLVFSLSMAASVALVYLALYSGKKWLQRLLTARFIVYSGTISYGLYLLHKLPFNMAQRLGLDDYPILAFPILFAACYGIAALSWTLLEKPCLKLKRFFEPRPVRTEDAAREYDVQRSGR